MIATESGFSDRSWFSSSSTSLSSSTVRLSGENPSSAVMIAPFPNLTFRSLTCAPALNAIPLWSTAPIVTAPCKAKVPSFSTADCVSTADPFFKVSVPVPCKVSSPPFAMWKCGPLSATIPFPFKSIASFLLISIVLQVISFFAAPSSPAIRVITSPSFAASSASANVRYFCSPILA